MKKGTIFNIQKMSIHDGPGIRTTVFFKGCPLKCLWCSNPESQKLEKEVACFHARCVSCGYCAQVCPKGLIGAQPPFAIINREECDLCGICVKECCTNAKKIVGEEYTVDELLKEIVKDKSFYDSSGGGVTFSGGEPLMQPLFLKGMLKACKEAGIHTAIETTGMADREVLLEVASLLNLIYFDVKHMDDAVHKDITGVSNEKILANLTALAEIHDNIVVRIPVIPGINDSKENLRKTADYAAALSISLIELLPYHNLGEVKYGQLGREYKLSETKKPPADHMLSLADEMRNSIGTRNTRVDIVKSM